MEEKELTPEQALAILKNRNSALEVNHLIGSRDIANQELEEICESIDKFVIPTFEKALEENEKLKKWQIDLIECFDEVDKIFNFKALEKKVLAMRQENMVSIEVVKKIVENEKCKVCDSKWHKGCRCARNKIITELDKLKGGDRNE